MSKLCRIAHCSRSLLKGCRSDIEAQIRQIVATAQTRNSEAGLRGALTFNENCFAQVLEGADAIWRHFMRRSGVTRGIPT